MLNPRIIIIGGNAAGPAAAAKAKRINPDAEVIIYEAGDFISTGTCEIPYVLSGDIKDSKSIINFDANEFYNKKGVKVYTGHLAEKIDPAKKIIFVKQLRGNRMHEVKYDKLILCTGSSAKDIGFNADNLFSLKNVRDLLSVQDYIVSQKVKNVVIIGAGFIGIEAAESFSKLGCSITITDISDKPFSSAEPEIQNLVLSKLKEKDILFYKAVSIKPQFSGNKIESLNIDGRFVESDLVISAIGFIPNTFLSDQLKLRKGNSGAVKVDKFLRTSLPDIYAAGDLIEIIDKTTSDGFYMPLASAALESGHIAGENAAGGMKMMEPAVRNISVKIFDRYYAIAGLTKNEVQAKGLFSDSIDCWTNNHNRNIPGSEKVYGKLIFNKVSKKIYGASFWGGREVEGFVNLVSAMISLNQNAEILTNINYTYTPPLAPMKNLLSMLGWKLKNRS